MATADHTRLRRARGAARPADGRLADGSSRKVPRTASASSSSRKMPQLPGGGASPQGAQPSRAAPVDSTSPQSPPLPGGAATQWLQWLEDAYAAAVTVRHALHAQNAERDREFARTLDAAVLHPLGLLLGPPAGGNSAHGSPADSTGCAGAFPAEHGSLADSTSSETPDAVPAPAQAGAPAQPVPRATPPRARPVRSTAASSGTAVRRTAVRRTAVRRTRSTRRGMP
jgi:hypothetical protein